MKQAIVDLAKQLPEPGKIISTVHDELILEVPAEQAEAVAPLVRERMAEPMEKLFPGVPIVVEVKICQQWGEK
jgi:DNA polymerase-1